LDNESLKKPSHTHIAGNLWPACYKQNTTTEANDYFRIRHFGKMHALLPSPAAAEDTDVSLKNARFWPVPVTDANVSNPCSSAARSHLNVLLPQSESRMSHGFAIKQPLICAKQSLSSVDNYMRLSHSYAAFFWVIPLILFRQ